MAGVAFLQRTLLGTDFLAVAVIILVAGIALFFQTDPVKRRGSFGENIRSLLVAVLAFNTIVRPSQRKARHSMVEFLLRLQGETPQHTKKSENP